MLKLHLSTRVGSAVDQIRALGDGWGGSVFKRGERSILLKGRLRQLPVLLLPL